MTVCEREGGGRCVSRGPVEEAPTCSESLRAEVCLRCGQGVGQGVGREGLALAGVGARPEALRLVGCGRSVGVRVGGRRFRGQTCGRRVPGTVEGARGRRPCERRSARGGTRGVCAGGTGRAVRVCACARRACPAVLKDTSGRRRRSRCPGDVTARPSIIARCLSRARIRAEATAAAGAGTVAPGRPGRPQRRPRGRSAPSGPAALVDLPGSLRGGPHALLRPGQRRAGPAGAKKEAGTGGAASGGGGGRGAAGGGGSSRPGRVTALGAGRGEPGERPLRVSRLSTNGWSAFSPAPARGEDASAGLKKTLVFISEHRDSFFEPHSWRAPGPGRGGTQQGENRCREPGAAQSERALHLSAARGRRRPDAHTRWLPTSAPPRDSTGPLASGTPQEACLGPPPCCGRETRVGSSELGADPGWSPRKHRRRGAAPPPRPPAPLRSRGSVRGLGARTPREPEPRPRPRPGRPPQPEGPSACSQRTLI